MKTTSRQLLLVIVAGVAVFAGISIYADTRELGARLASFNWWTFVAALGLAVVNYVLRLWRWNLYLRRCDIKIPGKLSTQVFLSGFALSVTPGKLGELIKAYLLRETAGVPIPQSAPIVVAERVTDLAALLVLGVIGVALYGVAQGMVVAGAIVTAIALVLLSWPLLARSVINLTTRPSFLQRFRKKLLSFYEGLAALVRPVPLAWAIAIGTVAWLAECIGFAIIISGFSGSAVPLGLAMLIYAATTVAGALSFLPGGLLVTEAAMASLLVASSAGMDKAGAAAATILTRLATLWFAVLIGIVALAWLRKSRPNVSRALDRAEDPPTPLPDALPESSPGSESNAE